MFCQNYFILILYSYILEAGGLLPKVEPKITEKNYSRFQISSQYWLSVFYLKECQRKHLISLEKPEYFLRYKLYYFIMYSKPSLTYCDTKGKKVKITSNKIIILIPHAQFYIPLMWKIWNQKEKEFNQIISSFTNMMEPI